MFQSPFVWSMRILSLNARAHSALVPKIRIFWSKKKGKILKCASWLRFSTKNECRYRKTNAERYPPWERGGREKKSRPTDRNRQKDRAWSISHLHTYTHNRQLLLSRMNASIAYLVSPTAERRALSSEYFQYRMPWHRLTQHCLFGDQMAFPTHEE